MSAALALGDDALVLSHRLGECAGHAPVLEEEVALANIALDLLGQARMLLSFVGDEDELAYLRELGVTVPRKILLRADAFRR